MSLLGNKENRIEFIDYLKGNLIILVIIGHLLPGSIQENLIRHTIYSFHMPLFLAVSGYLITSQRINNYTFKDLFVRYSKRMMIPWLLAFVVFTGGNIILSQYPVGLKSLVKSILYPWYHLWFIPALLGMVIFLFFIEKANIKPCIVLLVCFTFSWFWIIINNSNPASSGYTILGDKRLYFMFIFFYLGYYLRKNKNKFDFNKNYNNLGLVVAFLAMLRILDFFVDFIPLVSTSIYIVLNALLIIYSFTLINQSNFFLQDVIAFIGINSLPIYLWHVLPIWLMRSFKIDLQVPALYYTFTTFILIALIFSLKFIPKKGVWNVLLYGKS